MAGLVRKFPQEKTFIRELYKTDWVVYTKEPFAGPGQVVEYLGRYTHKVAISNHRLLDIDDSGVRFRYRDYRDDRQKEMTLDGAEFLRRFCQHILPKRFVRIRYYGLLFTAKRPELRELQQAFGIDIPVFKEKKNWKQICREHLNYNPDSCPCCGKGSEKNMINYYMHLANIMIIRLLWPCLNPSFLFFGSENHRKLSLYPLPE
ncbi:MAG: hypothetical protein D4R64_10990 [Porphyromonadaceae bacterium]|nr:MAG: hypothetical protein D4R64_10990 [Porphyromonadaceae bacterium]